MRFRRWHNNSFNAFLTEKPRLRPGLFLGAEQLGVP
jgi:hypothetical protein